MTQYKKYIAIILLVLPFSGCQDPDPSVEIDSISAWGNEFYLQEKVKVWAAVKTDNLPAARYTWTADGGTFTQPQSLDENTWRAPREPGMYTVTCVVDVDGVQRTRSRKMNVLPIYYFDKFEKTPLSMSGSGSTVTQAGTTDKYIETRVSNSTTPRGYIQRSFGDLELKVPFSTQAHMGWINNWPAGQVTINSIITQNTFYYEWTANRDPDELDRQYVDNIQFEWYPRGRTGGLPNSGPPLNMQWNGNLRFRVRDLDAFGTTTTLNVFVNSPALTMAQGVYKKVSMSIDADYMAYIYVDGVEVIKTNVLQQWRLTSNGGTGSKDDIYINQWRLNYVGNTGSNQPRVYFDDPVAYHDGTILTN